MKFKRFKYAALAAAIVAGAVAAPAATEAASKGSWKKAKDGRQYYQFSDNTYAKREFVGGYYVRGNGYWDGVKKKAGWHQDKTGNWWFGYADGSWYAKGSWWKIDGVWYCFDRKGYAITDGYVKGYYLNKSGKYNENSSRFYWHQSKSAANAGKWWYGTSDGTDYLADGWFKIDGMTYRFDEDGWLLTWRVSEIEGKVYGFNSKGTEKEFTKITPADTIGAEIKFEVTDDNKFDAAQDMNDFLVMYTKAGAQKVMTFNGVSKTVLHESNGDTDVITVDGTPLVEYFSINPNITEITVSGSGSVEKLLDRIDFIADNAESKSYNYSVTIGGVEFTQFRFNGSVDAVNFTAEGKNYTGIVDLDNATCYILTDITGTDAFSVLKDAGVIGAASVEKPAHPWWQ